jgi:hypothetical protein
VLQSAASMAVTRHRASATWDSAGVCALLASTRVTAQGDAHRPEAGDGGTSFGVEEGLHRVCGHKAASRKEVLGGG